MQTKNIPYSLGLDIGIASVGWCLLGENRIIDLGVRAFDKAETAKEGDSLNLVRRTARLMRRRLRRRAWRLTKLARTLKRHGVIADTNLFQPQQPFVQSIWQLRVQGLDRQLNAEEWARVIYHLCKHRGFHWVSRAEEKQAESDKKSEGGKVKQGLAGTKRLMAEKGYRSAAEMVLTEFPEAQRNKAGDYGKALSRVILGEELALLFARQREFGNPHATTALQADVLGNGDRKSGLLWAQKPALAGADLLKMLGHCTFEKNEYRAPKASFTAERHVWLTRVNNLRIVVDGVTRPLNAQEREIALSLPYQQAGDFTYKQLRSALVKAGRVPESCRFAGLAYPSAAQQEVGKTKDPEAAVLTKLPAWQELRLTLKKAGLETEWEGMAGAAISGQPQLLDDIAWVLSVFKDDDEVAAELRKLPLPAAEKMVDALLDLRFDKFHALSLKALRLIVPHMESGLRYDEACVKTGYHHSQLEDAASTAQKYLPPLYAARNKDGRMVFSEDMDIPRNPVVLRSLNQARKVVNAIIRRYGSPQAVHIELARDLSRPLDERREIEKEQKAFRDRNDEVRTKFIELFGFDPKGRELEKYRLYEEQSCKCAYSGEPLDIDRVVNDKTYVEIDHALPYSRSFDDSKNNKVLVLAKENRDKGNRTPYEYLDGKNDSPRWRRFVTYVETNKAYRLAKRSRLLRKEFGDNEAAEFRERNLNDTRYICRFFKNYVERYLKLADGSEAKRCVVVSGQLTAFLRARWGLIKVRSDSDRHHALDAAVVAVCSHGMVKRLADYSRRKEVGTAREGFVDAETGEIINPAMFQQLHAHFPDPWPHFRHELEARLKIDDSALLRTEMERLGAYPEEALLALRPLFVSRAPQRRNSGAAHKDTIYSQPEKIGSSGLVVQHIGLHELTRSHFGYLEEYFNEKRLRLCADGLNRKEAADLFLIFADPDSHLWKERKQPECLLAAPLRNKEFYESIYDQLAEHEWNGKKAFGDGYRKPTRRKNAVNSPLVRKIAVTEKLSGIPVRGGIAKNDTMLRVDIFTKDGKFHLVPIYVHHSAAKELPSRAIVAYKNEEAWTPIDCTYNFCFSLYPNDLVEIRLKSETHRGYYAGTDRSTGAISLWAHDRNQQVGKDGLIRGIGAKTALSIEKFHVDVLGNIYPAPPEPRRGLA